MQVLIIGNDTPIDNPESYYQKYQQFFETASLYSSSRPRIDYTFFEDLIISVGDGEFSIYDARNGVDISAYSMVVVRGQGFRGNFDVLKTISSYCRHHDNVVINDYSGFRDSSKLMQATQFFELGIPVARTVFVTRAVLSGGNSVEIEFPCIMKDVFGAHGNDNYLINNMLEASRIADNNIGKKFVLQRFVPNDNDYRILIVGDEVLVFGREAAQGSHLNNTSQGGVATLIPQHDLPSKVIKDARRISDHLGMKISGVDVLADKNTGEYYFLEVNSQPQLMTGAFIDQKAVIVGRLFDSL